MLLEKDRASALSFLFINLKKCFMAKYSKKAGEKVEKVMREKKRGTLKSGRSGKKVTSRKQAIAIGLSEARKAGAKVPKKKGARSSARKKSTSK